MIGKAEIRATLQPGQNGTKQLLRQYGDQLVCVRYRYDKLRGKRLKTIELVIDEKDWVPGVNFPATRRVSIRVDYNETKLREHVKAAGGYWDPDKKAWQLTFSKALELGLDRRILDEDLNF